MTIPRRACTAMPVMIIAFATACASIMHGTRQDVAFSSTPPNARVLVDGQQVGTTPYTAKLPRKTEHTVRIELAGYRPFELKLERKVAGWFWGNLLFGGLIGIVVDASNGAMYKLTPAQVSAQLATGPANGGTSPDALFVAVTLRPDTSWERIGALPRQ